MRGSLLASRRRLVVAFACSMLSIGLTAVATPAAHAGGEGSAMVSMANQERVERGLPRYAVSGELASVAQSWALTLAKSGDLRHNPSLRSQVSNYRWVGENVGYGADAAQIHEALMKSPAHRANILDRDYTQIGLGTARDSKGLLWIAQVFREPMNAPKAAPKAAPTPTKKVAPKPSPTASSVGSTTNAGNAAPPRTTKPKATKPAPQPAPRPIPRPVPPPRLSFAERLAEANEWATAADRDPLASTLGFARAMETLAS